MRGRSAIRLAATGRRAATLAVGCALLWIGRALVGTEPLAAQTGDRAALAALVDSMAAAAIDSGRAAGMSVGVLRGTDTLLIRAYGSADLELGVPTPEDAVYEIGSVTKQFTATAVHLLAEEGELSLDDDLSAWMPEYPLEGRALPLRRLLDHTSGIKGYTEMSAFGALAVQDLPRDSLVTLFAAEPFEFEPGEALIYNNSAYFLLGLIIEKATGSSYEEFVESRLFEPAGMARSRYCHKDELTPGRAEGYQMGDDGLRPADYLDHRWPYSAGSLCSTVRDLLRWNQALHGDGEGGDLLSSESYREMVTPATLADGTRLRYASGLQVTDRDGETRISHGGGIFGYLSELRYFPHADLSIVVLVNTAGPTRPSAIASAVEDAVLGPEAPLVPRTWSGSLTPFVGTYGGPARGRRMNAVVSEADGELRIKTGTEDPEPVHWLGGTTFANGATRFTFVRGADGFDVLQVDHVAGVYVLRRVTR